MRDEAGIPPARMTIAAELGVAVSHQEAPTRWMLAVLGGGQGPPTRPEDISRRSRRNATAVPSGAGTDVTRAGVAAAGATGGADSDEVAAQKGQHLA